jgi:ubiquinone biosynthesis protein Coq4
MSTPTALPLNAYQVLARKIIVHARTSFLIPIFRRLYGAETARVQLIFLQSLPAGTLGRGVSDILAQHHLQLIPHYENHDLKHVLLGYDMTPEDELKLKAFMLGNGDWSITCIGFLLFAILTPEVWPALRQHYYRGRQTQPVVRWTLAEYAAQNTAELRQRIGLPSIQSVPNHVAAA